MSTKEKKKKLRLKHLSPKTKLKEVRRAREISTSEAAALVGLERRQYELKEKGVYPFHDYEIFILADFFGLEVTDLFF